MYVFLQKFDFFFIFPQLCETTWESIDIFFLLEDTNKYAKKIYIHTRSQYTGWNIWAKR